MRNPDRIYKILNKLHQAWIQYPDTRLCQLVQTIAKINDVYYVEDDVFEVNLDAWIEQHRGLN